MLPVSGAEQLNTSGAMGERPMISHKGAYSRLVSPAPCSVSGRNRFQRSRAPWPFYFKSSTAALVALGLPARRFSCTSR